MKKLFIAFKIIILFILFTVIILLFLKKEESKVKYENNFPIGIGVNLHGGVKEQDILNFKQIGVKYVRIDLRWEVIEKEKGKYDFSFYDRLTKNLIKNNIKPFFILNYSNGLYEKERSILTEGGREAFASFVEKAVKRYRNNMIIWEVWNEPNIEEFWNTQPSYYDYGLLVEKVIPIIKRNDPSGFVVAPALSGISEESLNWFQKLLQNENIIKGLDAISVHPYRDSVPETASVSYQRIRQILDQHSNRNIPIINSEWGYAVGSQADGIFLTEAEQANFIVRSLLIDMYNKVPISMLYVWRDTGSNPTIKQQNFGLRNYNNVPKSVFFALMNFNDVLNGFNFKSRLGTENDGDYIFNFTNKEKREIIVYWTTGNNHEVLTSLSEGSGNLIDLYGAYGGKDKKIEWNDENLVLSLTKSPQYLIINE